MERMLLAIFVLIGFVGGVRSQTDEQRRACVVVGTLANGVVAGYGTGTVIEYQGKRFILTCAHVARGCEDDGETSDTPAEGHQIRMMGGVVKSKELSADIVADVAILAADEVPADVIPFSVSRVPAKVGDGLRLLTRGGMTPDRSHCRFKSAVLGPGSNDFHCLVACLVQSGDSGAPYLNEAGQIVGLQSSGVVRHEFGIGDSKRYWPSYGPSVEPILAVLEGVK